MRFALVCARVYRSYAVFLRLVSTLSIWGAFLAW